MRNRVVTEYNIHNMGFKPFIQEILTPKRYDKNSDDTKLNFKLISLVYESLSCKELVELMKYAFAECPALKLNLLSSLQQYLQETENEEKIDIIKQFYLDIRTPSFD
jgi:hypothetical protein